MTSLAFSFKNVSIVSRTNNDIFGLPVISGSQGVTDKRCVVTMVTTMSSFTIFLDVVFLFSNPYIKM